jgi:hypothetical protein
MLSGGPQRPLEDRRPHVQTVRRRRSAMSSLSQSPIHQRARMELISIVAATSVYTPAPMALDPFVEDSHLVGLFVRR